MKKVLISIKHTSATDDFLTLWRGNDAGYTISLLAAGKYDVIKPGYHESENTYPIDWAKAVECSISHEEYGTVIPNDSFTRDTLGLKIVNNKLVRIGDFI